MLEQTHSSGDLSSEACAEILCETYLAMIQVHFVEVQEEIEQDSTNSRVAGEEDEGNVMEDHEAFDVATFVSCKLQLHIVWEHRAIAHRAQRVLIVVSPEAKATLLEEAWEFELMHIVCLIGKSRVTVFRSYC